MVVIDLCNDDGNDDVDVEDESCKDTVKGEDDDYREGAASKFLSSCGNTTCAAAASSSSSSSSSGCCRDSLSSRKRQRNEDCYDHYHERDGENDNVEEGDDHSPLPSPSVFSIRLFEDKKMTACTNNVGAKCTVGVGVGVSSATFSTTRNSRDMTTTTEDNDDYNGDDNGDDYHDNHSQNETLQQQLLRQEEEGVTVASKNTMKRTSMRTIPKRGQNNLKNDDNSSEEGEVEVIELSQSYTSSEKHQEQNKQRGALDNDTHDSNAAVHEISTTSMSSYHTRTPLQYNHGSTSLSVASTTHNFNLQKQQGKKKDKQNNSALERGVPSYKAEEVVLLLSSSSEEEEIGHQHHHHDEHDGDDDNDDECIISNHSTLNINNNYSDTASLLRNKSSFSTLSSSVMTQGKKQLHYHPQQQQDKRQRHFGSSPLQSNRQPMQNQLSDNGTLMTPTCTLPSHCGNASPLSNDKSNVDDGDICHSNKSNASILQSPVGRTASLTLSLETSPFFDAMDQQQSLSPWSPNLPSPSPSTGTITPFRNKKQVPVPAVPILTEEGRNNTGRSVTDDMNNEIGGKLYPDLRHEFILALLEHAKQNRRSSHERSVFDTTVRAITILSLHEYPVRTWEASKSIKGIGHELSIVLKETACGSGSVNKKKRKRKRLPVEDDDNRPRHCSSYAPPTGKFSAVAPAALVALLQFEMENGIGTSSTSTSSDNNTNGKDETNNSSNSNKTLPACLCTMEELIRRINHLIDHHVNITLERPISYYLDKDTMDPGWAQVKKLTGCNSYSTMLSSPCIKERRRKGLSPSGVCYELLHSGRQLAERMRKLAQLGPFSDGPLRQLASSSVSEEYGNVTMSVDFREGGGGTHSLHKMCDLLDLHCIPYVVRELKISDYVFFVGNKLAPILVERKTVDDVANSLADGRWERQQRNMRKAQFVLGGGPERRCQICYLIEGDANRRTVHGGKVGRHSWNQSLENVESAIEKLPELGFSVMKSKSTMGSVFVLSQIARDVSWKAQNGSIDADLTYEEFLHRIRRCDDKEGDPPTSRQHQYPAAPVVDPTSIDPGQSRALDAESHSEVRSVAQPQATNCSNGAFVEHAGQASELEKLSVAALKDMCKERDEKQSGTKLELVSRLLKPRKPELLILRSRRGQYVPKVPSCNAALMVALLINHRPGTEGLTKENLMFLAEETGVSKEPMGGNGGWYDGWAGMKDLTKGDPALVFVNKRKYSLTTQPPGTSGVDVAKALHLLAHRQDICRCGNFFDS